MQENKYFLTIFFYLGGKINFLLKKQGSYSFGILTLN